MISKKAKRLAWDKMGYNETGEKIKFRIDEVIISSHGAIEGDMMEIGAATFSYEGEYGTLYKPNELERKSMNLLYLSCCYSGSLSAHLTADPNSPMWNVALAFLFSHHDIGEVVGWDGQTKYASSLVLSWDDLSFHYGETYTAETLKSDYKGEIRYRKITEDTYEYTWKEGIIS